MDKVKLMREEVATRIVANDEVIDHILTCLFAAGHILVESPPGLGKTEISKTVAETMDMEFKRIQCTPDLKPADIIGELRSEMFVKGPLFTNILLVDEINRALPKTQSAFLEAMAEKNATLGGRPHSLPEPFMVVATQNPVEYEGTYNLPEAQQDRFLLKTHMTYLAPDDEKAAIRMASAKKQVKKLFTPGEVIELQRKVREEVEAGEDVVDYIVALVGATRARKEVLVGASTRAAILFTQATKAKAFLEGRTEASVDDARALAHPVLRHRLLMNPDSKNFGYTSDDLIEDLLRKVREP